MQPRGLDAEYVSGGESLVRVRRPLPLAKALDDVMLAYEVNGEPLPAADPADGQERLRAGERRDVPGGGEPGAARPAAFRHLDAAGPSPGRGRSVPWTPGIPGPTRLLARATDTAGRTQPDTAVFNTQGYLFDAVVRHPVTVV